MPAQLPGLSTETCTVKITIASPDKDLLQIADTWFYDYSKRTIYFVKTVSLHKFCHQLITGDSGQYPRMFQAGAAAATLEVNIIAKEGLDKVAAILRIKAFYISWHTLSIKSQAVKQKKRILRKL
jgi:hypothetical protein